MVGVALAKASAPVSKSPPVAPQGDPSQRPATWAEQPAAWKAALYYDRLRLAALNGQ